MPPLLPTYLITTHRAKGLRGCPHAVLTPFDPNGPDGRWVNSQYPDDVRLTAFWGLMRDQFGEAYAQSVAKDYVFGSLGGRTVERALADGVDAKVVWRAVCDTFNVPENRR